MDKDAYIKERRAAVAACPGFVALRNDPEWCGNCARREGEHTAPLPTVAEARAALGELVVVPHGAHRYPYTVDALIAAVRREEDVVAQVRAGVAEGYAAGRAQAFEEAAQECSRLAWVRGAEPPMLARDCEQAIRNLAKVSS